MHADNHTTIRKNTKRINIVWLSLNAVKTNITLKKEKTTKKCRASLLAILIPPVNTINFLNNMR